MHAQEDTSHVLLKHMAYVIAESESELAYEPLDETEASSAWLLSSDFADNPYYCGFILGQWIYLDIRNAKPEIQ
jgi:hypothetical protein